LNNQQTLESEKALIASVLSDNSQIDKVMPIVKSEMFYHSFHETLWNKIVSLHGSGVKIDLTTLSSQLTNHDSPNGIPMYEVTGFFDYMTSPSSAVQYAKNIYEKYELRRLKVLTNELSNSIGHDNVKTVDSLTKIHNKIGNVLSVHGDNEFDLNSSLDKAILDMYNKDNTIKFGFGPLDNVVGGMRRGEITVIAGRPGHFKSTMAVNIVHKLLDS
jgi:replicative DNA helicase